MVLKERVVIPGDLASWPYGYSLSPFPFFFDGAISLVRAAALDFFGH
jgi:hypothetical protein